MVAARFAALSSRYLLGLIVLLSAGLIWWSVMVRLTGASDAEVVQQREQNVQFNLNNLRWRRDKLAGQLADAGWAGLDATLLDEPAGLVPFLDQLRAISAAAGMSLRYDVGERATMAFDPDLGQRVVQLRFDSVTYSRLLEFLRALGALSAERLFVVSELGLEDRGGNGVLSGRLALTVWTREETGIDTTDFLNF